MRKQRMHRRSQARKRSGTELTRAFTLIELLVVIAIIGLLASIILASVNVARLKSGDSKRVSDLQQMSTVLLELADSGNPALDGCNGNRGADQTTDCTGNAAALAQYKDPSGSTVSCKGTASGHPSTGPCAYTLGTTWGGMTTNAVEADDYEICTYLQAGSGSLPPGLVNITSTDVGTVMAGCY